MRIILPLTLCGALAVGTIGCEDRETSRHQPVPPTDTTQPPVAPPPVEQAEVESSAERTGIVDDSRTMMDTLHERWVQFKASSKETGREIKAETREAMDNADAKWEQLKRDFDNWKHASGEAWDAAKVRFDQSYEHFKQAFTDARESYDAHRVEPAPLPEPEVKPEPAPTPPPEIEPAPIVPEPDAAK